MAKRCNCGEMMKAIDIVDYPKQYVCPVCGATLMIDNKGIQKWYNADGEQGTYAPKEKENVK